MKKGIVLEIKNNKAVILNNDGTYEEVKNNNYKIGQKVELKAKFNQNYLKAVASVAVAFVVSFSGYKAYCTPASYVYVDINPSLRIDLNIFDQIIDITPLNEDAETLVKENNIKRDNIETCMEDIVKICKEKEYLSEENTDININYTTTHKELEEKINDIHNHFEDEFEFKVKELPKEDRKELEDNLRKNNKQEKVKEIVEPVFDGNISKEEPNEIEEIKPDESNGNKDRNIPSEEIRNDKQEFLEENMEPQDNQPKNQDFSQDKENLMNDQDVPKTDEQNDEKKEPDRDKATKPSNNKEDLEGGNKDIVPNSNKQQNIEQGKKQELNNKDSEIKELEKPIEQMPLNNKENQEMKQDFKPDNEKNNKNF